MRVDELKNKILQLAIQGKLVPQDSNDEPASVLLERIKKEKEQLIKEKKIKKEKPLPEISEEEKAFEIPEGWEWCRLGDIIQINPRNKADDDMEVSFVPMALIQDGYSSVHYSEIRTWHDIKNGFTHFADDDVVIAKITPCFENRKSAIMKNLKNRMGAGTTELFVLRGYDKSILPKFIFNLVISKEFIEKGKSTYTGTAGQQRIKKEFIINYVIALPPLQEQKRIVSKIDELFSIIDKLAENKESLSKNIDITRDKVLQLAIQGKLVPQDPDDEPASVLLERIKKEKEQLIKEKKIKKEKPLPEISEEEKAFEIPKGWEWCRLGDIISIASGKNLTKNDMNSDGNIPVYGGNGVVGFHNEYNVSEKTIVIGRVGFYCGSIHLTENKAWITDNAFITNFNDRLMNRDFLILILKTTNLKGKENSTAQPVISGKKIYPLTIAIPPLQEQKRIVAKVDGIMGYLDKLQDLIDGKSLEIEGVQAKEIALSKAEELVQK